MWLITQVKIRMYKCASEPWNKPHLASTQNMGNNPSRRHAYVHEFYPKYGLQAARGARLTRCFLTRQCHSRFDKLCFVILGPLLCSSCSLTSFCGTTQTQKNEQLVVLQVRSVSSRSAQPHVNAFDCEKWCEKMHDQMRALRGRSWVHAKSHLNTDLEVLDSIWRFRRLSFAYSGVPWPKWLESAASGISTTWTERVRRRWCSRGKGGSLSNPR
jgi:hypothetical protein